MVSQPVRLFPLPGSRIERRQLELRIIGERFAMVLTSPLSRARRTCELAGFGGAAEVVPDLAEWDYGDYEGIRQSQGITNVDSVPSA